MNEEINTVGDGEIHYSSEIANDIGKRYFPNIYYIEHDYIIDETWQVSSYDPYLIDGQGHTIYGNGKQAFRIGDKGVEIRNLTFVNCSGSFVKKDGSIYNNHDGGAIHFKHSGYVKNCSFVNCSASKGGAIYFKDSGYVTNCSFVNCSASNGAAIYDIDHVKVYLCSFENCVDNNGSTPLFKPKVIIAVDDIKGVSGSTVKVDVGVYDMLGTPINEGTVTISLNGKEYTAKVVNGVATFNILIPSKEGIYSAKVFFNGEGTDYDNTTCDFTVTSVEDNTKDINKSVVSNNMENCGTPLVALLIALISLPLIRRK